MQLFTMQEIQAVLGVLNRTPMTPAEVLFVNGFFQRLAQFCQPPKPEVKPEPLTKEQGQALIEDLERTDEMAAMAEVEVENTVG